MKQLLKKIAIRALGPGHIFPSTATPKADVQNLINTLHPRTVEKGLIRLGPEGDGGYLIPNDLAGISACFSPGVSAVSGFEKDCAERGIPVFLADKSVTQPADTHPLFHFTPKYIGVTTNADFMKLEDWVKDSLPPTHPVTERSRSALSHSQIRSAIHSPSAANCVSPSDLLLQMDIEGYEYETFLATPDDLMRRFRIIVVELHWLDQLWSWPFFQLASRALEKLLQTHTCVHIHPNNCGILLTKDGLPIPATIEATFLRNDRLDSDRYANTFPHPLDVNNTSAPPITLPPNWYRAA